MSGSGSPFSRLVRGRMEERGLGLRELCRAAGLDPSFFSKVLADKRNPPHEEEVLRRLARELDLDPLLLIVAAGRLPSEWDRLRSDLALFDEVCRMVTPGRARRPAAPEPARPLPEGRVFRKPEALGEELL